MALDIDETKVKLQIIASRAMEAYNVLDQIQSNIYSDPVEGDVKPTTTQISKLKKIANRLITELKDEVTNL